MPRWTLSALSLAAASVLWWGACVLPWQDFTAFAVLTGVLAWLHGITGLVALAGLDLRARAWRIQSWASLAWLGWIGWKLGTAGVYIAQVYGGMGEGMAVVLWACAGLCALVVLPLACWGLAATGGLKWRRTEQGAAVVAAALGAGGLGLSAMEAQAQATPAGLQPTQLAVLSPAPGPAAPSLYRTATSGCPEPPGPDLATAFVTWAQVPGGVGPTVTARCVQAPDAAGLIPALQDATASAAPGSRLVVDVVSAVQVLPALSGTVAALALRPGRDGACRGSSCLTPWQLVVGDRFNSHTPFPAVPDVRFGVDPGALQQALGSSGSVDLAGLTRIETRTFVVEAGGEVTALERLHGPRPEVTPAALAAAAAAAQARVLDASNDDGRFRYLLDPFTGEISDKHFQLPRQGGTTYTLCDVGDDSEAVTDVARRSLQMMADLARDLGDDRAALQFPAESKRRRVGLRMSTLPLVAFLTCRARTGPEHDALIGQLGRFLMAMQKPGGGYHPGWDKQRGEPVPGPELVYSGGQATMALVLLEGLQRQEQNPLWPSVEELAAAVERAMAYYGGPYWDHGAREFLWIEENWHCIAAREALDFHRSDAYERFCLDYVGMKRRLVLGPDDGVDDDMVGGFGWGNLGVPHNTGTAGYLEALSAAMAVKHARGGDLTEDTASLRHSLGYLLQNQWTETTCFACSPEHAVVGSWSEHMASPVIRIDYIQHAWAGVAHGARMLALGTRG